MSIRKYGASSFKRPMTEEKEMSEVKRFKPVINSTPYTPYAYCEENEDGIYVRIHDYAEIKAERDALANENLAIKAKIAIHAGGFSVCPVCSHEEPSESDDIVWMVNETPTPATNAYANQLRAEGVEMFAKHFNCADISDDIFEFAANLRKENGND